MLVLSEATDQLEPSASARDLKASTEAARLVGCQVYTIPPDFTLCENADNALWHIPHQPAEQLAVWIGYIPTAERYRAIYEAARAKNIRLINDPEEHRRAQEFDSAYPFLKGLTPESVIITDPAQCQDAVQQLGLPVFVKGAVQSRKAKGWKACVAETVEELQQLTTWLIDLDARSRGRVIVRQLVKLRHSRTSGQDFPLGREYRVFLLQGQIVGLGYYWEGDDPLKALSALERQQVETLAREAARRLEVPYIAVDIGQMEDRKWTIIETGDAQFSGVSQIPLLQLWNALLHQGSNQQ